MNSAAEPVGTLEVALAHTARLLRTDPQLAAEQAAEILKVVPNHPTATHLLGMARRELENADALYAQHIRASLHDPRLLAAATALCDNRIPHAEALLREHLKQQPTDVAAIRMLAEVAARLRRYADAETLLARCLELAPEFAAARHNYAMVLHRQYKEAEALIELDRLLQDEPDNSAYRNLKAVVLGRVGEYKESLELYAAVLEKNPRNAKVWMSYGHALKTAGREPEGVDAYRKCIELTPGCGEAYWSLANLKTFRFTPAEVDAMRAQLRSSELSTEDRFHFHFSLGKALEDAGRFAESFEHYAHGNKLRRSVISYSADANALHVRRSKEIFSPEFFAARTGYGADVQDPIFIVGLPRAGSTLLEQILSSHSAVEGTMELHDIAMLAAKVGGRKLRGEGAKYPRILESLSAEQCRELGELYIKQTRIQRKTDAPFFIDKMPNNFSHIGFIHLILPHAKIVDARRHPLGCCFSGFKQHFARGQSFTYELGELGRYYSDYVELMAHFDAVLPGRVHRVFYENMVADTETEVHRLLAYCGLPFEEGCLRFYQNERAVRTASSQQVRQPIFRDAVEHWRNYEPWLGALKSALGPVLDAYPSAPKF